MSADAYGNDVSKVFVPVTGNLGVAPSGTTIPTPSAGAAIPLTLDPGFQRPGLIVEDGGFEWTLEADGDPIEFFQQGYTIPTGLAKCELVVKLAQTDSIVRGIIWGKTPDANGYITIDAGGTANRYSVFTEEIDKFSRIRRRVGADGGITGVKEDKSERGSVKGYEVTFSFDRSPLLDNEHLGEWVIEPVSTVAPTITASSPSTTAPVGSQVTITGTGFNGATAVKFGTDNAGLFVVDSSTQIRATVPARTAGSGNITVVTPAGTSNARTFATS